MDGATHDDALDGRVRQLEQRVAALETRLAATSAAAGPTTPTSPAIAPVVAAADRSRAPLWGPDAPATAAPVPTAVPMPTAARQPRWSVADLEAQLTGRVLAWVGGLALVVGAILFLGLAFSRGWIGPEARVVIGLVAGSVALGLGAVRMDRGDRLLGHVLTPVGLAVISLSMIGATRLYDLIPVPIGLVVVLISAIAAALVAIRADTQAVAAFGLVAVLVAPPLLGAAPDLATLAFVATVLIGTTAVALWRTWPWLPPVAFLLSAPQVAAWILGDVAVPIAMVGLIGYSALNLVAAAGEEVRRPSRPISPSSTTLLLANAGFLVWAGFQVLSDAPMDDLRGVFLLVVAGVHLGIGGWFVRRDGDASEFGLLTMATGIAALTMAAPVQLDAPAVPVAWTAEAVALVWVAQRRSHRQAAVASAVLFGLAATAVVWLHLAAVLSRAFNSDVDVAPIIPFVEPLGAALAFFLGGVAVGVWMARRYPVATALAALGIGVASLVLPYHLQDQALVAGWSLLLAAGFAIDRWLASSRSGSPAAPRPTRFDQLVLKVAAIIAGLCATGHLVTVQLPFGTSERGELPEIPFVDPAMLGAAALLAALLAIAGMSRPQRTASHALLAAIALVTYVLPFEVEPWVVVILWSGVAGVTVVAPRVAWLVADHWLVAGYAVAVLAMSMAVVVVAPYHRLLVDKVATDPVVIAQTVVAFAALVGCGIVLGRATRSRDLRRAMWVITGSVAVYAISVAVVDLVGLTMRDAVPLDELQTRGQVALSATWAIVGMSAFVIGLRRHLAPLRLGGLALLAIATVKVFVWNLSALDVAYRVISLVVLGLVLLTGAWLWQRQQPKPANESA